MTLRTALFGGLLLLQGLLVVTGGAVRLTGSGLGCPTWPECTPGSYKPVPHQVEGQLHAWIEFGNRLLTFALVACALAVFIYVLRTQRRDLRFLAATQILGIVGQAVLGGITVLTDLNPVPVAGHLLLSILLISAATSLFQRRYRPQRKVVPADRTLSLLSQLHILLAFIVILLGTIVTGSGPHAGDIQSRRFGFEIRSVAWLHADAVIALFGITLALYVLHSISPQSKRALKVFAIIALAQGAIGYIQFILGIPELLVAVHLLGATLVWVAAWRVRTSIVREEI